MRRLLHGCIDFYATARSYKCPSNNVLTALGRPPGLTPRADSGRQSAYSRRIQVIRSGCPRRGRFPGRPAATRLPFRDDRVHRRRSAQSDRTPHPPQPSNEMGGAHDQGWTGRNYEAGARAKSPRRKRVNRGVTMAAPPALSGEATRAPQGSAVGLRAGPISAASINCSCSR